MSKLCADMKQLVVVRLQEQLCGLLNDLRMYDQSKFHAQGDPADAKALA